MEMILKIRSHDDARAAIELLMTYMQGSASDKPHAEQPQEDLDTVIDRMYPEHMVIEELPLKTWTINVLLAQEVFTARQLAKMIDRDLLVLPNFGKKCLEDVKAALHYHETAWKKANLK